MKFFQKIRCFFTGHEKWSIPQNNGTMWTVAPSHALVIAHTDYKWSAALEVCPRCLTLWARVLPGLDLDKIRESLPPRSLSFDTEKIPVQKLPPEIECEFLDELTDNTFKVKVVQRMNFIANYIEIESYNGKIVAWELDAPKDMSMSTPSGEESIHLQISGLLAKVQDPYVVYVSQPVFSVLDFPLKSVLKQASNGIIGTGQANTQGINAQGTLSQQKPASTGVAGPGKLRTF